MKGGRGSRHQPWWKVKTVRKDLGVSVGDERTRSSSLWISSLSPKSVGHTEKVQVGPWSPVQFPTTRTGRVLLCFSVLKWLGDSTLLEPVTGTVLLSGHVFSDFPIRFKLYYQVVIEILRETPGFLRLSVWPVYIRSVVVVGFFS